MGRHAARNAGRAPVLPKGGKPPYDIDARMRAAGQLQTFTTDRSRASQHGANGVVRPVAHHGLRASAAGCSLTPVNGPIWLNRAHRQALAVLLRLGGDIASPGVWTRYNRRAGRARPRHSAQDQLRPQAAQAIGSEEYSFPVDAGHILVDSPLKERCRSFDRQRLCSALTRLDTLALGKPGSIVVSPLPGRA
jgi:hypothetical protein